MNPNQYHGVRVMLDQAIHLFMVGAANHSTDDRKLLWQLEILRSQMLKAESGHPFPLDPSLSFSRAPDLAEAQSLVTPPELEEAAAAKKKRIRVVIADDHDSVRAVLRALLAAEGDVDVIAEAVNGREAVELVSASKPDIVIMDLNMPVLDGVSATREALQVSPESKVLVFSANRDSGSVQKAADAGAVGYLFKPATRQVLVGALRSVYRGEKVFPEQSSTLTSFR